MSLFNKVVILFMPLVPKFIVRMFSKRYVAGSKLDDAVEAVKKLNARGIMATMDVLGESTSDKKKTGNYVEEYLTVLQALKDENLDCNISLKPTQLGLLIDPDLCYENIKRIVVKAKELDNFVRVDMEDSANTTATIEIFKRLRAEFDNVGLVLQAYLRRTIDDLIDLTSEKSNFRICKGIYIEPRHLAYKDAHLINENFAYALETGFKRGSYIGIATHDEKVVWHALRIIEQLNLKRENYEFQMLFGVDEELGAIIATAGHCLRIYVPFGKEWYAYVMRRLKENPTIAMYVIKALFTKKYRENEK
jgi:proline dehydrogenase